MRSLYGVVFALGAGLATTAGAVQIVGVAPDGGLFYKDTAEKSLPAGSPQVVVTASGITFNIYYMDIINNSNVGFDGPSGAAAKARVSDAFTYIASVVHESGTLDVVVSPSETDGSGFLAFAGTYYPVAKGTFPGSTLARLHDPGDAKPFSGTEEIFMTVDFGFPWNFTTADAAFSEFDFQSVLTHEFTHGLGFASLETSTGASSITANCYTNYDKLLRRRAGNTALVSGNPPSFVGQVADLTSANLAWGGGEAIQAYLPNPAPGIYAPSTFQSGSSLSHWDTGNIIGGAVMEHAISNGETRRQYAAIDIGALRDIGYLDASVPVQANCILENGCPPLEAQGTALIASLAGSALPSGTTWQSLDLDSGGIPDRYEAALVRAVLCGSTVLGSTATCTFNANLATLQGESAYALIGPNADDVVAALASTGTEMQSALSVLGLTGSYVAIGAAKLANEPLSPSGDPDQDGLTNLQEYLNVSAAGGSEADYVAAALNPLLDGTAASASALPVVEIAGLGALCVALGAAGAVNARRKRG